MNAIEKEIQEMIANATKKDKATITEQAQTIERMRKHLQSYIYEFDGSNSDRIVKEWLDRRWIPDTRDLLAELEAKK